MFQARSESPRLTPKNNDERSTVIEEPLIVASGAVAPFTPEVKTEKVRCPFMMGETISCID
jgi:hypothetical protein